MQTASYFVVAGLLTAGAFVLSAGSVRQINNLPLAMVQLAEKLAACSGSRGHYRTMEFSCASSISFSDVRKLDMRADNRARSLLSKGKKVMP